MKKDLNSTWSVNPEEFISCKNVEERIKFLLRYAVLAPSAHNTQPWKCRIIGSVLEVFYDKQYALHYSDPTHRQALLSLGCFVANFCLAANAYGLEVKVTWLPEGNNLDKPVATLEVAKPSQVLSSAESAAILQTITKRRVNRGYFSNQQIPQKVTGGRKNNQDGDCNIHWITKQDDRERISRLIALGTKFAFSNSRFREELSNYIVANNSDRLDGIPGNTAGLNLLTSIVLPKIIKRFDIGVSQAATEYKRFMNAPALLVITTETDNHRSWLAAGYLFEELALDLTQNDLSYSMSGAAIEPPISPAIIQRIIGTNGRPQILCRVGYGTASPPHSPRRGVLDILDS